MYQLAHVSLHETLERFRYNAKIKGEKSVRVPLHSSASYDVDVDVQVEVVGACLTVPRLTSTLKAQNVQVD